jgi:hypothetical protein
MLRLLAAVCVLVVAPAALAAPRDALAARPTQRLTEQRAIAIFRREPKVADWLDRYPPKPITSADFDPDTREWSVKIWSGAAGQIALGTVDDVTGDVTEAWTGPQVAWKMARGTPGAFGGKQVNNPVVWLAFCAVFLLGLANLRRPLSLRNLDLVALLAFSVSLWFFNRGEIFRSVPLAYPPLVYVIGRLVWIGWRGNRADADRPVWPVWVLAAAAVFLMGFRIGLNIEAPYSTIDVGYSGVVGAHRIAHGEAPYGHMPVVDSRPPCGPADSEGNIQLRVQTNGRCEHADERGDTYGPVSYLSYVPGYLLFGWSGKWAGDKLPAAHFTSIVFDVLCLVGLVLVGVRYGGIRLAATLALAWAAYPFTLYALNSNTNDAIVPAFLIWGFWLASSPAPRGALVALSGLTKFASLIVVPLWLTYRGSAARFLAGFAFASVAAFSILLLEPNLVDAARTFYDRTVGWQLGRDSPFSLWGWGQYHAAGIPDLHLVQAALELLLVAAAIAAAFVPRRKSPLQLAALTGALVAGFELVLTHWFYLYIPWFFPFAAFAVLATVSPVAGREPAEELHDREPRELVPAGR